MKHLPRILTSVVGLVILLTIVHFQDISFVKTIKEVLSGMGFCWIMMTIHKSIFKEDF